MTDLSRDLETKVASASGPDAVYAEMMNAFEEFRAANDARLADLEARGASDPLTEEKLERISKTLDAQQKRLDELAVKAARPALSGAPETSSGIAAKERKAAFESYMRRGDAARLIRIEEKSMSAGSGPDGGYLAHDELETEVGKMLSQASPVRAVAGVRRISAGTYRKPFSTSGAAAGWAGETSARPQTDASTLAELTFPAMELYAMPAATQTLLDDAAVDIGQWLASEIISAFAAQETDAFVNGDGVTRPKGFLTAPAVAESAWSWGSLGFIASGADGAFAASNPSDALVDLVYALKSGYRQNAVWMMNRRTQGEIRKIKDADGNYLWRPAASAETKPTLMGFPVAEVEEMPDMATDSLSLAFGDFRRGYLIVDRAGVRVLRDPYSAKPYVLFYTTKRVGGGIQDFDAIKLMKFSA